MELRQLADVDRQGAMHQLASEGGMDDIILVEPGSLLPPFWAERMLATLAEPGVLAVGTLEPAMLPGIEAPNDAAALARLDALCHAAGPREALDARLDHAAVVAVRGAALAELEAAGFALDPDALPSAWRVVRRMDLLVAPAPGRQPAGRSATYPELASRLAAALAMDVPDPGWPGLDGKPVVLHVNHGWGGGAARWVGDLAASDPARHHLVLSSHGSFKRRCHGEAWRLADARQPDWYWREFRPARGIADSAVHHPVWHDFLAGIRRDFGVDAVVVSSLIGHSLDALRTGLPTVCVVHDHYPLWPVLHRNFGDPALAFDDAQLEADLAAAGRDFEFAHRQPGHWQALRQAFVEAMLATKVQLVAPSNSAMAAELRLAPELQALPQRVIPHGLAPWQHPLALPEPPQRKRLRLVVPGRIRGGKGADLLHAIVPAIGEHVELVLLGAGAAGMDFFGISGVHVVLDYQREDLPRLMAKLAPDAALIVPGVAETFSYTLSEMLSLGLPVIATDVGALGERITDGENGLLVAPEAGKLQALLAGLDREQLQVVRENFAAAPAQPALQAMGRAWSALLPREAGKPATGAGCAGIDAQQLHATTRQLQRLRQKLAASEKRIAVLEAEVERRAEWAGRLDREQREAARVIDKLNTEVEQRNAWARELDEAQSRARTLIEQLNSEIETSNAWARSLDKDIEALHGERDALMTELDGTRTTLDTTRGERDELQAERQMILASRSWRLTRPLRVGARFARRVRASLRFRWARARSLKGRLRGSLHRRGLKGTLKRIAREFEGRQKASPAPHAVASPVPQPATQFEPFAVPGSEIPQVSIVIPVYNKFEYTEACLRSLAEQAGEATFEVIVVDDASSDATAANLARIDGIRVLANEDNLGFIGSCNAGAAMARGDFIVLLNNDTVVTAGWLEAMLACFAEREDAGLVGARLVYPDGRLQEAGGIVFNDGSGWNYGRLEHPDDPRFGFRREVDYCSGAAIMLPRKLWQALDGFDARYTPAYYEDTDLAFRVRQAGRKVYVEPHAVVVHYEGISNGTDTGSGIKRYQTVNHGKFLETWREVLERHPAPIDGPARAHLAATWRASRRVLVVDASTPEPDQDSGSVRLLNIMRQMRDMGCQVSFLPDNLARFDKYTPLLQAEGIEALYHPFVESLPSFYRERGGEFDLIMVSRHYILAHHLELIRLHAPQARLAFDTVDLHYLREARALELEPNAELRRQAEATRKQELGLINASDVTLVVSKVEKELLATDAPGARVEILSNVHEIHGTDVGYDERRDLLFIGGFQHPPNIDAMLWFVGEVLPLIHEKLPEVKLNIVGSKIVPEVEALASDRVIVHGFVEDIEPLLEGARIALAPLRYGAGVKGKVNMAMSRGLPVVATPMAVEGIDAEHGRDVMVGADAESFAASVVELYGDPALWSRLSQNGTENVRRQFSFDAARRTLERLLQPVSDDSSPVR